MDLLNYVRNNVPFYTNLFEKEISNIKDYPIIDKKTVMEHYDDFISNKYKSYPYTDTLNIHTSGSSGEWFVVKWDKDDYCKSNMLPSYYRYKFYNIHPSDRLLTFHNDFYLEDSQFPLDMPYIYLNNSKVLSVNKELFRKFNQETIDAIKEFQPKWISTQPTTLILFCDLLKRLNIDLSSVSYIECNGEHLHESSKKYIELFFNVPIKDNYGLSEIGYVTFQCPLGHKHILRNNYLEIVKNQNEKYGSIVVSSLINHAMPLIRYNTGDIGSLETVDCPYFSKNSLVLDTLVGRESKFVKLDNNGKIDPFFFSSMIDKINNLIGFAIRQFNIVQITLYDFNVYISLTDKYKGWTSVIEQEFLDVLPCEYFKKMCKWKFFFVNQILPKEKTGKIQYFDSYIEDICNE